MVDHFSKLRDVSKKFPNQAGVYFWRDQKGAPLYIGRAGSLKKRISNYFTNRVDPRIREMTESARSLDFETTDTLLEAIVLEANLIKQYWPKYNILEKDGKSFIYLVITDEQFPRLLLVRGRELSKYGITPLFTAVNKKNNGAGKGVLGVFGPYQSYYLLRKALEIVRRIFPYSNCRPPRLSFRSTHPESMDAGFRVKPGMTEGTGKPCFHYQIGLCPGVCVGAVDAKTYYNNIRNLILFFRGDKKQLLKKLQKENPDAIKALKQVRDTALLADSDVLLRGNQLTERRIEGYDISHSSGKEPVGAMVVFENGEADPSQYRLFNIRGGDGSRVPSADGPRMTEGSSQDDLAMLQEVLERRLNHSEWPLPQIIFIDGGANQVRRANAVLKKRGINLPIVGLSKAGKHAASAAGEDKLVVANVKKTGRELIIASRNLFQQVRNEAHRFAIRSQRRRSTRGFLKK